MPSYRSLEEAVRDIESRSLTFVARRQRLKTITNQAVLAISKGPDSRSELGAAHSLLSLEAAMDAALNQTIDLVAAYLLNRYLVVLKSNGSAGELNQSAPTVEKQVQKGQEFWQSVLRQVSGKYGDKITQLAMEKTGMF